MKTDPNVPDRVNDTQPSLPACPNCGMPESAPVPAMRCQRFRCGGFIDPDAHGKHYPSLACTRIAELQSALRELIAWSDQNEPLHEAMRNAKAVLHGH